jgi:tetratricopeptide (TPR) repeat protein
MNDLLERARLLRMHRRHDEAKAAIMLHLAGEPDCADGHFELAVTLFNQGGQSRAALEAMDRAISLRPDDALLHAVRAGILNDLDQHAQALAAADAALALDPELPLAWFYRGCVLLDQRLLGEAELAARKALALDPDFADASNLLATVLRLQKRFDESAGQTNRQLERNPENPRSFSVAGWTALNQGDRQKAEQMFLEALRLNPVLEDARLGLREAYKARSLPYRLYLRWVFFLQRYSEKNQWLIIIGIFLAYRFGRAILSSIHPLAAVPLIVAYLLFCFGGWLASGLGHFLLLKDPLARLTLNRAEKLDGIAVGGLFFGGLLLLIAGVTVLPVAVALLGGALMGAAIPAGLVFDNPSTTGRVLFGLTTVGVIFCGALSCGIALKGDVRWESVNPAALPYLFMAAMAVFLTTWIGGIRSLREAKPV